MKKHLAIFSVGIGEKILNGEKTIESRFSRAKIAPFGIVSNGDLVYIKPAGEEIIGQFRVKKVISFEGLDLDDLSNIKEQYGEFLAVSEDFWDQHQAAKYGTLIFIGESNKFITSPIKIPKKDLRGWVVLD